MRPFSASPSEDSASMMQSRKHCLALSAQALSPLQPLLAKEAEERQHQVPMLSVAIWKRRAMPPTGFPAIHALTPRTGWWRVSLKRAGTGRSLTRRRSQGKIAVHDAANAAPIADPASSAYWPPNLKTVWDAPDDGCSPQEAHCTHPRS